MSPRFTWAGKLVVSAKVAGRGRVIPSLQGQPIEKRIEILEKRIEEVWQELEREFRAVRKSIEEEASARAKADADETQARRKAVGELRQLLQEATLGQFHIRWWEALLIIAGIALVTWG